MNPSLSGMLGLFAALCCSAVAVAEEAAPIRRGTDGLTPVPFQALNRSDAAIACTAAIAHWYSLDIGRAAPGASVTASLWSDTSTGEVFLLNAMTDRMPVQALWCGVEGRAISTRSDVRLARRLGTPEPAISITCANSAPSGGLACLRDRN